MWQAILAFFFPHCEWLRQMSSSEPSIQTEQPSLKFFLGIRPPFGQSGRRSDYDYAWLFLTTLPKFSMSDEGLAHRLPPSHFTAGMQSFLLCNLDFNITIDFSNQIMDGACRSWISDHYPDAFGSPFSKNANIVVGLAVGCIAVDATGYINGSSIESASTIMFLW